MTPTNWARFFCLILLLSGCASQPVSTAAMLGSAQEAAAGKPAGTPLEFADLQPYLGKTCSIHHLGQNSNATNEDRIVTKSGGWVRASQIYKRL
jgi:hypothetical protein